MTVEESVRAATATVKEAGGLVDLVFTAVGVLHDQGRMPEISLSKVDPLFLRENFEVCCYYARLLFTAR